MTMTDNTTPERVERWTIRLHPDCGCGRTHEGTLLDVEIEAIPRTTLLRWLGERVKATRECDHLTGLVDAALATRKPVGDGERATGLRRGHLADLEVIEAILRSDPREEAGKYAANPRAMADAVRNMIEDPDLHNPESPGPIVFEVDPAPQEAE